MYCSGIEPVQVDTPCCNVDILPTVYNLFGMEYDSRLLMGIDVFANNTHIATLYNNSFITDKVKYNSKNGKAEWLPGTEGMSDAEKENYLNYCITTTKNRYAASLSLIDENFYRFVFGEPVVDKNE